MNQDRETLGQFLKRERELHLVSVQEIALSAGMAESLLNALEDDDFDAFSNRSQAVWLIKHYATCLDLNQKEVLQRFGLQWKLYGGVKRIPKLSHFTDAEPSPKKPVWIKGKGIPSVVLPKIKIRLPLVVMVLIVGFVLLIYLPDSKQDTTPPEPLPLSETEHKTAPPERNALPPETDTGRTDSSRKNVPAADSHHARSAIDKKTLSQPKSVKIIGNRDTKRYHLPGMKYYEQIKAYHRIVFRSEKEAINAGYRKARE
ncbi:MAG: helix-turn-helix domain-containing protein [Deltaproteobacteria bacterium]|nr:helix-turn-helix domain-containing protein [Deltaproteobacteria bacterium]